jgi:hypothetical protein
MRRLGDRLGVTIRPNHTWGGVLNEINPKIAALPDKTAEEQRTKHRWSEVRTDLWHVKEAWRDDSMHGKRSYTPQQASEVLTACRVFMQHLAKL